MDFIWTELQKVFGLFMPSNFSLFQNLLVIGVCFGVVIYLIKFFKGD